MIVMKFGGTSVGDGERIANVAKLVLKEKPPVVVVVSALGGVTDKLVGIANRVVELPTQVVEKEVGIFHREIVLQHRNAALEAVRSKRVVSEVLPKISELADQLKVALLGVGYLEDLSPKSLDYIMSFGERLSSIIVSGALESMGAKSVALTGYEAGVVTDSNFGHARPKPNVMKDAVRQKLMPLLRKGIIPVVTGFVGGDEKGRITTLGRGGSDYSASLIGRYLKVKEVQIWTDVDGILTTDPKMVKHARLIPELSYVEAMDLAYFGAKVIHSKMIEPAMVANIPVRVLNTFNPSCEGTLIVRKQKKVEGIIKAVAITKDVVVMNLQGIGMAETPNIAGRLFSVLGNGNINVIMISGSSESNLSFVIKSKEVKRAIELLAEEFGDGDIRGVGTMEGVSIISVVGAGMQGAKGIAAKVFETVSNANVNIIMIAQGSSEVNIAFAVNEKDAGKALEALHGRFVA
ncbi:MAG: aspartate kinase [Candidatus Altiarchaeota archaeon]|nr:aspartate kinase [Candidatus Altiarchaeota archaeon]